MSNKKLAFIYVLFFSLFWAFSILASKYAIKNGVNPITLAPQTLLFSTLMIIIYLYFSKTFSLKNTSKKSIYGSIVSGIIGGGLANFASIYGLNFTTSINAGFLVKTATAFTVIFAFLFLKEPISKIKALFVLILLVGAYLLSTGGKGIAPHLGDIYILMAALGFSFAAVLNRLFIKKDIHPDVVSFFRSGMGFVTTFLLVTLLNESVLNITMIDFVILIAFLQAGVYIFLNKVLSVASASYMTMMSMITPVTVAIFAIPLFQESLNLVQWMGAGLIVFSGVMTQVKDIAGHD
jgi:DME family drug/metabolite transporter